MFKPASTTFPAMLTEPELAIRVNVVLYFRATIPDPPLPPVSPNQRPAPPPPPVLTPPLPPHP